MCFGQKDGYCNDEINNADCNYDGGDCCGSCVVTEKCSECQCLGGLAGNGGSSPSIGDSICNEESKSYECNYDNGDCCENGELIGNGYCNDEANNAVCIYDGGDCCVNINTDNCLECQCWGGGFLTSPGFPQNYESNLDLNWLIQVPFRQAIEIVFYSFDVESHSSCE